HAEVPFRLLEEVPALSCQPADGSDTENLIVQGDNLEALKALLPRYAGQVKCIYIDPPYNTGNEGWVYNDAVNSPEIRQWLGKVVGKEAEDLSRHDKWLCMMYPRLALLRQFLREDGAIFISIDDNEVAALRLLMDEVFGGQNFVSTICWQKIFTVKNSGRYLSEMHDFVVVYAAKKDSWVPNLSARTESADSNYANVDDDTRGVWTSNALQSRNFYSKGTYSIRCPGGRFIEGPPSGTYWRMEESKLWALDSDKRVWWGKSGNNSPRIKKFLSEAKQGMVPTTWWTHEFAGTNSGAKTELRSILGDLTSFMTPKPKELIQRILEIATKPGDLILDTFAGSGTTAHAVLASNSVSAERRFILCEIDEKIASDITAERVRRVAQGYTKAKGEKVEGLGGGFQFVKLGKTLFDETGAIRADVKFAELAEFVFFRETGRPLRRLAQGRKRTALLGRHEGRGIYLLFNGILGDRSVAGGNVLTGPILAELPPHAGPKVIYAAACRMGRARLEAEQILFKQTPYDLQIA
ncbi:MAG: site-specific DNA-methyltransferase, partial [Terrimicrobiaceae bacterium]